MRRVSVVALYLSFAIASVLAQGQPAPAPSAGPRPAQAPLGANQWQIDPNHSSAGFSVRHNVVSTVRGKLGPISGIIEYDGKNISSVKAEVSVDVKGVNTQNERRDADLRGDGFFDAANHPALTFKSKRVEPGTGGHFKLIGDLSIRGNSREVALDVEGPAPTVKSPRGVLTGATATTKISRKEFGMLWNNLIESLPVVGDEVSITIDLELNRPALPGQP